ncbi:hypothetical protein EDB89DRAFT_686058 [Lactarius sanguifluus]|nr:hypothetical protein EDB89DRAFT_686058 [Lactarius sanguifluus]
MAHYDIFRHHLAIKFPAHGHALWDPDPGSLYPAVEVGDVGYIREGKFYRLFNVLLPTDDESHVLFGVPENYEQLELNINRHINIGRLSPNNFCSAKVTSMPVSDRSAQGPDEIPKVSFSCLMREGVVLYLPIEGYGGEHGSKRRFRKVDNQAYRPLVGVGPTAWTGNWPDGGHHPGHRDSSHKILD